MVETPEQITAKLRKAITELKLDLARVPITRMDLTRIVHRALGVHLDNFLAIDAMLFSCQTSMDGSRFQIGLLASWLAKNLAAIKLMPLNKPVTHRRQTTYGNMKVTQLSRNSGFRSVGRNRTVSQPF